MVQAFKETQIGRKPPGVFQTLLGVVSQVKSTNSLQNSCTCIVYRVLWWSLLYGPWTIQLTLNKDSLYHIIVVIALFIAVQGYRALWTGMGSQLARDVPFSAICWSTLEPVRFIILSYECLVVFINNILHLLSQSFLFLLSRWEGNLLIWLEVMKPMRWLFLVQISQLVLLQEALQLLPHAH